MSEAKHTPGPWAISKGYDGSISVSATRPYRINNISAGTPIICDVYQHPEFDSFSGAANARLIAAAPEMLEACKNLLNLTQLIANEAYDDESLVEFEVFNEITKRTRWLVLVDELAKARTAIAKATGRADSGQAAQGDRHE